MTPIKRLAELRMSYFDRLQARIVELALSQISLHPRGVSGQVCVAFRPSPNF